MEKDIKQMTLAEVEARIKALQEQRQELLLKDLEPLKAEIEQTYLALLDKVKQVRAVQQDYLPPWIEKKLMMNFEAD